MKSYLGTGLLILEYESSVIVKSPTPKGLSFPSKISFADYPEGGHQILSGKRQLWSHSLYIIGLKMADGELVILATQEHPETALADYKQRWQIETLFGCLKTRGFDLEATHITDQKRLEKLLAFLAIAFCWSHLVGEWLHEVKPITLKNHGRPAQSLFRYGFDYLRACLFHYHESARQHAFHQALEQLFKRLGWSPHNSPSSPPIDSIPLTI